MPVTALSEFVNEAIAEPKEASAAYAVRTEWESATRFAVSTQPMRLGGRRVARSFSWKLDEPRQLLGSNHAANPQELLLSGVAGCIGIAFVMGATARGVQIESLEIELSGELDLRGFLGLGDGASPGFAGLSYVMRVAADAPLALLKELCRDAIAHSPNAQTILNAVPIEGELIANAPAKA